MAARKTPSFTELTGGDRLYNLFKKKLEKNPTNIIMRKKPKAAPGMPTENEEEEELCITIPLKGAKGGVSYLNPFVLFFKIAKYLITGN